MLLDETQVALNELVVAYQEATDHIADAVKYLDDAELVELFEDIHDRHAGAAELLSEEVRRSGTLPRAQDADREQIHQMFTHVKAALSEDDGKVFIKDRLDQERHIERTLAETLTLSTPAATQAVLQQLLRTQKEILTKLNATL